MGSQELGNSLGEADQCANPRRLPTVSVVMPTFRRSNTVARALRSIVSQDYPNVEIVIVDDNDEPAISMATLQAIQSVPTRCTLRLIGTPGRIGGGAARNLGARAASGDYLAFLDDDDEFLEEKLSRQVRFMQERNLDLSYQDVTWVDESGSLVEYRRLDHATGFSQTELLRAHLRIPISPTSIYMVRREYFLSTAGFGDVKVGQDWILMLRCIEAGGAIEYMRGAYVRQYLHLGERLSTGREKLEGENALFRVRKSYFHQLTSADRRFIRFRHYAVLAVASFRSHFYFRATSAAVQAVVVSPGAAISQGWAYVVGRRRRGRAVEVRDSDERSTPATRAFRRDEAGSARPRGHERE